MEFCCETSSQVSIRYRVPLTSEQSEKCCSPLPASRASCHYFRPAPKHGVIYNTRYHLPLRSKIQDVT